MEYRNKVNENTPQRRTSMSLKIKDFWLSIEKESLTEYGGAEN
ncbi:hypothetical protein [Dyadobacter helix]|nr:hypothetical protein [Dyadobacter sp. CECT 9275]